MYSLHVIVAPRRQSTGLGRMLLPTGVDDCQTNSLTVRQVLGELKAPDISSKVRTEFAAIGSQQQIRMRCRALQGRSYRLADSYARSLASSG